MEKPTHAEETHQEVITAVEETGSPETTPAQTSQPDVPEETDPEDDAPQSAPEATEPPETTEADIEARIAEAETRGYLRGRNESIAELMREPAVFERQHAPGTPPPQENREDSQPMILNNPRVSIWDL